MDCVRCATWLSYQTLTRISPRRRCALPERPVIRPETWKDVDAHPAYTADLVLAAVDAAAWPADGCRSVMTRSIRDRT